MARLSEHDTIRIKQFMARTLRDHPSKVAGRENKTSPTKMQNLVKKETGLEVTRQTISRWLQEGVEGYLRTTNISDNEEIKEYTELMDSARQIWNNPDNKATERTKAYNSYLKAKKQKEALMKALATHEVEKARAEKPNYLIKIVPKSAMHTCPECGHKFYDVGDKDDKKTQDENKRTEE